MVLALEDLAEGALSNQLDQLESVVYLVSRYDSVVTFTIIEAVIDEPFQLGWLILLVGLGKVEDFFKLGDFRLLVNRQVMLGRGHLLKAFSIDGKMNLGTGRPHLHCQLVPLGHFWNRRHALVSSVHKRIVAARQGVLHCSGLHPLLFVRA